ncbi:hypothetical protein HWV62_29993, partial [Athelia sp. TMB]
VSEGRERARQRSMGKGVFSRDPGYGGNGQALAVGCVRTHLPGYIGAGSGVWPVMQGSRWVEPGFLRTNKSGNIKERCLPFRWVLREKPPVRPENGEVRYA